MAIDIYNKTTIDIGGCCSNSFHVFLPSKSGKVMLSMLKQLHAEPMKVHSNNNYRESQWQQEAIVPVIFVKNKIRKYDEFFSLIIQEEATVITKITVLYKTILRNYVISDRCRVSYLSLMTCS